MSKTFNYKLFPDIGDTIKGWIKIEGIFSDFKECYFDVIDTDEDSGDVVMIPNIEMTSYNNELSEVFPKIYSTSSELALRMSWEAKFQIGKYEYHLLDCRIPEFEDIACITQFNQITIPYKLWVKVLDRDGLDWLMIYHNNSLIFNFSNSKLVRTPSLAVPIMHFSVDYFESIHKNNKKSGKEMYMINGLVITKI